MKTFKKIMVRGLGGICIGAFISQFIYLMVAISQTTITLTSDQVVKQFILCTIIGFYTSAISVVFEIEQWSLMRQTITHAVLILPYFPVAFYANWLPPSAIGIILYIIGYIVAYIMIWFSFRAYWKKKANEMNQELQNYQQDNRAQ